MNELFVQSATFQRLYNCSLYNVSEIPLAERQWPVQGSFFLAMGIVQEALYAVCMCAIWRNLSVSPCYALMLVMGAGLFGLFGVVYCSCPVINYVAGALGLGLWYAETLVEMTLALDRCVEMCSPWLGKRLFGGRRVWLWVGAALAYAVYFTWYWPPLTFSAVYFSWYFDPHVGYSVPQLQESDYMYFYHRVHDWMVTFGLTAVYLVFGLTLYVKGRQVHLDKGAHQAHKTAFFQIVLISAVNVTAAVIYEFMNYDLSGWLVVVANVAWVQVHGIPPIIYLALNPSLRRDILEIVVHGCCCCFGQPTTTPSAAAAGWKMKGKNNNNKVAPAGGAGRRISRLPAGVPAANNDLQQQQPPQQQQQRGVVSHLHRQSTLG